MSGRNNPGSLGVYAKGDPGGMEGGRSLAARKRCPPLGVGRADEGDGLSWPLDSQQETAAPQPRQGLWTLAPGSSGWVLRPVPAAPGERQKMSREGDTQPRRRHGVGGMRKPLPLECWSLKLLHPGRPSPRGLSSLQGIDPSLPQGHSMPGNAGIFGDTLDAAFPKQQSLS